MGKRRKRERGTRANSEPFLLKRGREEEDERGKDAVGVTAGFWRDHPKDKFRAKKTTRCRYEMREIYKIM